MASQAPATYTPAGSPREYTIQWVPVIICPDCNEDIVERADCLHVTTVAQARRYAREHDDWHQADERQARRNRD